LIVTLLRLYLETMYEFKLKGKFLLDRLTFKSGKNANINIRQIKYTKFYQDYDT